MPIPRTPEEWLGLASSAKNFNSQWEEAVKTMQKADTNVLLDANDLVAGERQEEYGHPSQNHCCTAAMITAYLTRKGILNKPLTARDVCMINVLQKVSRDAFKEKRDNLVDIAGWARNAEMVEGG